MSNLDELPYISSSEDFIKTKPDVKPQDEMDMPALKRVAALLKQQIESYSSIDRLSVSEKDLNLVQQLAVNKSIQAHLIQIKALVDTTIEQVKEKYSA